MDIWSEQTNKPRHINFGTKLVEEEDNVTILSEKRRLYSLSLNVRLISWHQVKCSVNSEWVCSVLSRAEMLCA